MEPNSSNDAVFVEAPGRLHFGILDLGGSLGRWFGGIGAAAPVPPLRISATLASADVTCDGDDAGRAVEFAKRFLRHHDLETGARLQIERSLPRHAGLGSGTQLALAVARALAELHGKDTSVTSLALAVGRTRRSGVGMWVFDGGGFVLEGGRRSDSPVAPLLTRLFFPESWRVVVAIPPGVGISGEEEASTFDRLPQPPARDAERVAHHVLMALLPALIEGDLVTFGQSLSEVQRITGRWFASVQGDTFSGASRDLIQRFTALGAHGVGQSSWGPAVYGIVAGNEQAAALVHEVTPSLGSAGRIYAGAFRSAGARVWRQSPASPSVSST
jgi:beta-ribofuranosylaminobenzene 5'-phosphate synthase